jgi:N-acetylneuraminate synthase
MKTITLNSGKELGFGKPCYIIAEIGINHNGSLETTKQLIDAAVEAKVDAVKFQKRTPEICVPKDQWEIMRDTPWGKMTYIDYKWKTEFTKEQYLEIDRFCHELGINWFVSVWDTDSVDFMREISKETKMYDGTMKIPSALITDLKLCEYAMVNSNTFIISTGMSTEEEVRQCIKACAPDVIMHTNSTYPCPVEELNLNYINWLRSWYPDKEIGYSGHEYGLVTTFATIPMGVTWIERHITLDRSMWGSDQASSIEPSGLFKLVKGIRDIEKALSIPMSPRVVFGKELEKQKSLRK